ncbi:NAD(P)-dependent alcohol dehydrogenase [Alicyclobacillus kakegawensis]|uniref:NAD(P)-dependent alcohol dehydrogenase n=1 Tax=Alicyclobacillus kakegawensis TaxID=392012 RepID=UPI000832B620|nr:NAD(P)-dependent alcohol dehydrogenase [Alicyclobacillus kakegawensis]
MKARAAVIYEKDAPFQIEEVELDGPRAHEVLVKMVSSGICHTDAIAKAGEMPVSFPAVLGHEGAGIVKEVGSRVLTVRPGDHVVLTYSSCGDCENCLAGRPAYCTKFVSLNFIGEVSEERSGIMKGSQRVSKFFGQSSFATYAVVHERNVVKVAEDVELTLLAPLGCGILTGAGTVLSKLRPVAGDSIAVYGCGAVGLSAVMAAKLAGCFPIVAVDVIESRLAAAKQLGATHVVNGRDNPVSSVVKEITNGGSNFAVETTGNSQVVLEAVRGLRTLGVAAIVGVSGDVTFNMTADIMTEGKSVIGVVEGDAPPQLLIPRLVEFFRSGRFPFDKLCQVYTLDRIDEAFNDAQTGSVIKPVIQIQ